MDFSSVNEKVNEMERKGNDWPEIESYLRILGIVYIIVKRYANIYLQFSYYIRLIIKPHKIVV